MLATVLRLPGGSRPSQHHRRASAVLRVRRPNRTSNARACGGAGCAVSPSSAPGTQVATLLQEPPPSSHQRDLLLQRLASSVKLTEVDPGCHAVTSAVPTIPVYGSRRRGRRRIDQRSDLPAGHAVDAQRDPLRVPRRLVANRRPTTEWTWRSRNPRRAPALRLTGTIF